jgi:hypothetical protein
MREPRYRFPNEVRSTTRSIASWMLREGEVAESPEELEAWIAQRPEFLKPLEGGGYGKAFTARDLFPLLQAFLGAAAATPPADDAERGPSWERWVWIALLVILIAIAWMIAA